MGASISYVKSDKFPVGSGTSGYYLYLKTKNQISILIRVYIVVGCASAG
jgi:hypothetical protein